MLCEHAAAIRGRTQSLVRARAPSLMIFNRMVRSHRSAVTIAVGAGHYRCRSPDAKMDLAPLVGPLDSGLLR
jgi:hypothetical protein